MNLLHIHLPATTLGTESNASLLPPRLFRAVVIAVDAIVLFGVVRAAPPAGPRATIAWIAALAFAATFPFATFRRLTGWLLASAIGLWALCGITLQVLTPSGTSLIPIFVAITQASRLGAPWGPGLALATGLGYEVSAAKWFDPGSVLSSAIGFVFAYLAATSFRRLREEKHRTETLLQEVLAGRDAQVRAAALDERARIAREIHDILAHTLSALAVQLEGTRLLVEQRPGDPAALATLERASSLARAGLEETKRAVSTLRGDALPGPDELPYLIADFERDTGAVCRFIVEGEPLALSAEARLALYRTAQEALTNVRKHTVAASVVVRLRYGPQEAELTVEDEGTSRLAPLPGSGNGLNGMRERAALAHGRLEAGPTPTGFRVQLWLPT